jgi:Flp pilus assembly protein TadD
MGHPKRKTGAIRGAGARGQHALPRRPDMRRSVAAVTFLCVLVPVALLVFLEWRAAAALRRSSARTGMAVNPSAAPAGMEAEEQRLRETAARQPTNLSAHLELARFYADRGRAAEAVWEYQEAVTLHPAALPAQVGLATALGQLRLHGLAIARLEEQLRHQPRAVDLRRMLAELYLATGRPESGAAVLAADAGGVRSSPAALLVLGRTQLALGRLGLAQAAFQEDIRRAPQSAEAYYWLGRAAWIAGRLQLARQSWERAARLAPEDPRFPYCLGMSYARDPGAGSADRAGSAFDEALRRAPGYVPALLQVGLLFQQHGRPREAARRFLEVIDRAPTDPEPHLHLAAALSALGETAEAHRHRGFYYSLSDRPAPAVAEYEQYQRTTPERIDGPLLISQSYIQMQQNERAAAVVEAALRRHPREPALYERLGTLYILTHSRTEAGQIGEAWRRVQPEAAGPHWLLGRVALGSHQVEEAIRQFEAAVARDPNDAEYAISLGTALAREPEEATKQRALTLLRRAVALRPGEPEYHHQLGVMLQQLGQWESARRELLAVLSLDPDRASAYNCLAQLSQALRRPDQVPLWAEAMRAVQARLSEEKRQRREAGQSPHDPSHYYALAKTLLQGGEVAKAQSQLEQALQFRPGWPEARHLLDQVTALRAVL